MNGKLPVSRDTFVSEKDPEQHRKHLYDLLEFMALGQKGFIEKVKGNFKMVWVSVAVLFVLVLAFHGEKAVAAALRVIGGF